jgi:hypothetical protein
MSDAAAVRGLGRRLRMSVGMGERPKLVLIPIGDAVIRSPLFRRFGREEGGDP